MRIALALLIAAGLVHAQSEEKKTTTRAPMLPSGAGTTRIAVSVGELDSLLWAEFKGGGLVRPQPGDKRLKTMPQGGTSIEDLELSLRLVAGQTRSVSELLGSTMSGKASKREIVLWALKADNTAEVTHEYSECTLVRYAFPNFDRSSGAHLSEQLVFRPGRFVGQDVDVMQGQAGKSSAAATSGGSKSGRRRFRVRNRGMESTQPLRSFRLEVEGIQGLDPQVVSVEVGDIELGGAPKFGQITIKARLGSGLAGWWRELEKGNPRRKLTLSIQDDTKGETVRTYEFSDCEPVSWTPLVGGSIGQPQSNHEQIVLKYGSLNVEGS